MSWIIPLPLPIAIVLARPILSVLTPTLNASVRLTIDVLKPDIETTFWSFNSKNGK